MDDGKTVDVVYLDFAKEFHSVLIFKADALSQEARIKSGALQGSAIWPLLFLFVNHLPSVIGFIMLLFDDDVKIRCSFWTF